MFVRETLRKGTQLSPGLNTITHVTIDHLCSAEKLFVICT